MIKYLITHSDMDGVGCTLSLTNTFKDLQHKPTGYFGMEKMATAISQLKDEVALMITDLNLRVEDTERFVNVKNVKSVLYIDHHLTNNFDEIRRIQKQYKDKLNMIITDRSAACKLVYHYCLNKGAKVEHLEKIINIISDYDTWKIHGPLFWDYSRPLNDLYWLYGYDEFLSRFKNGFTEFDKEQQGIIKDINTRRDTYLENSMKNFGQVVDTTLIVTNPDVQYANDYTLKFRDFDYYVILKGASYEKISFIIRVNVDNKVEFPDIVSDFKAVWVPWCEMGGHKKSGAVTIEKRNIDDFFDIFLPILQERLLNQPPF